ncbi:cytokine receptor family member B16 isoform X2 [Ictalurus punctatus]|uniref:Cytokine receptor family member B16 isoform X2 n=1 Tax=Ictalurus punctatus TaxID=7998 RepID=A0A2D0T9H4_ICTPU|nr:cytokine receptor family member B16 isoform X2 [Ictalurus punctatus]
MFQTRSLLKTVTSAFFIATLSHAALFPESLNISIQSENMMHTLKWRPLQEACCTVNYTVQYQGEFEYMQNDSWLIEHSCYEIVQTECDLTLALSSDSDYNIRVAARCDDSTLWTQLPNTFNRRDTVLLVPNMDVTPRGRQIEVNFSELQKHISINLHIWKKGDEHKAISKEITDKKSHHDAWLGGGTYCLKADAILDIINKTTSTDTHCVLIQEPLRLIPLYVGVAVALTLAVALILGLITPRFSLWLRKSMHNKEPLPNALIGWPKSVPIFSSKVLLEPTHSVLLLDPSEEQHRTSEMKATCDDERG